MKTLLLITVLFMVLVTRAQITINATSMPVLNDTVRYSTSATNISSILNDTGANKSWNVTNLVPDFQDIASFRSAANINFAYSGPFGSSSYGTESSDMALASGFGTATEVFNFYKTGAAAYVCDGRGFALNGLPLSQTYSPKEVIYKFPLAYGNTDSSSYTSSKVNVLIASLISAGTRVNTVDAWGTITTPYGTFNCLRVKSVVTGFDSVTLTGIPFPIKIPRNVTEYKWLTNTPTGRKIPLLEVTVATTGTTIKYRDIPRPEVFKPFARFTANKTKFAANSTDTCILTDASQHNPKGFIWTITPNTFSYVGGTNANSPVAKVFFGATGLYTVKLKVIYNAGTDDTTIVNYISVQQGPVANFGSSVSGATNTSTIVNFYDSSTGSPTPVQWKWNFSPSSISYVGGTSSTSPNPRVTFDAAGSYTVSLTATNAIGSNTVTKNGYLAVYNTAVKETHKENNLVAVYPNPADDHFELAANRNTVDHFEVYDITGKLHQLNYKWNDQQSCMVNCQQLNAGIYFVKVFHTNKEVSVKKFSIR